VERYLLVGPFPDPNATLPIFECYVTPVHTTKSYNSNETHPLERQTPRATIEHDDQIGAFEVVGGLVLANACDPCIGHWDRNLRQERR
jgi:hypothetical protein